MNFGLQLLDNFMFLLMFTVGLQIADVVNIMKDLIDYSGETGNGPMGKLYKTFLHLVYSRLLFGQKKFRSMAVCLSFFVLAKNILRKEVRNHIS